MLLARFTEPHPDRISHQQQIHQYAAAQDWDSAYRQIVLRDFADECKIGLRLAFLRTAAVPRMADILATGPMATEPMHRAVNTSIVMHELYYRGLNSDDARHWVRRLNRSHHGRGIAGEDMTYVLGLFMVVPTRYIARLGWRPLGDAEVLATVRWYQRLGELINVPNIPSSYAEAEQIVDRHEAAHVGPSANGARLGRANLDVLRSLMPRPLQLAAEPILTAQIAATQREQSARNITDALGLRPAPPAARWALRALTVARRPITRRLAPRELLIFTPGQRSQVYPDGYTTADFAV